MTQYSLRTLPELKISSFSTYYVVFVLMALPDRGPHKAFGCGKFKGDKCDAISS